MSEVPELRNYRPEDLDALYALDVECFEEPFRFSRATLKRFLESRQALTSVAEDYSGITGFILVHLHRKMSRFSGYVVTLDVRPMHRRSGLGSLLMRHAERLSQAADASGIRLHVSAENGPAQAFYTRLGYAQIGTAPNFYGNSLDALVLEKTL